MPKEIFGPYEHEAFREFISGPLVQIKNIEATRNHTTIAYWIPPSSINDKQICDDCGNKASFLLFDRDHMGQTSINLWCNDHVNPTFIRWLNEAN